MKDKLTLFLLVILFFNVVASTSNNSTDSDPLPRVYLSWYPLPPFTTEDTNVIGWLGAVCSHGHGIKLLPILTRGKNETDVLNHLENRKAQFAFPVVSSSKVSTYRGYKYLPLKLLLWLVCMGNSTFPLRQMRNLITLSSVTIEFTSSFTDCLRKHLG